MEQMPAGIAASPYVTAFSKPSEILVTFRAGARLTPGKRHVSTATRGSVVQRLLQTRGMPILLQPSAPQVLAEEWHNSYCDRSCLRKVDCCTRSNALPREFRSAHF